MKTALAVAVLFSLSLSLAAQSQKAVASNAPPQPAPASMQPAGPLLGNVLADLQRTTQAANGDLGKLRIERWKADDSEKQEMQKVAASLQKNMTMAIPGLINEVQATPASVSKAFKLYHDITVVYEFLSSLSEAAGAYGKKEEYQPLAHDVSALDSARQNLSNYIEQAANNLEIQAQKPAPTPTPQQAQSSQTPKKIIIDDGAPAKKAIKKKKPSPSSTPQPASSPPQ